MKKQTAINAFIWAMVIPLVCFIGWASWALIYHAIDRTMTIQSMEAQQAKIMYYETQR